MQAVTIGYFLKTRDNKYLTANAALTPNKNMAGLYISELEAKKYARKHDARVFCFVTSNYNLFYTLQTLVKTQFGYQLSFCGKGYTVTRNKKLVYENASFEDIQNLLDCVQYKKSVSRID